MVLSAAVLLFGQKNLTEVITSAAAGCSRAAPFVASVNGQRDEGLNRRATTTQKPLREPQARIMRLIRPPYRLCCCLSGARQIWRRKRVASGEYLNPRPEHRISENDQTAVPS